MGTIVGDGQGWLGMLVLDGFVIAKLSAGRGKIGWLIGPDDLIRPWEIGHIALARPVRWRALTPVRLALLDGGFSRRAAGSGGVTRELLARAARTTHWLLATSLVASSPTVEERLMLLFAQLGEKWGTVTPSGVWIDIPLAHTVLANLCGARRPTVTGALKSLRTRGLLLRAPNGGWLLCRQSGVRSEPASIGFSRYSEALALALNGHDEDGSDRVGAIIAERASQPRPDPGRADGNR
jgi:CRP-like cAMP-binding protein